MFKEVMGPTSIDALEQQLNESILINANTRRRAARRGFTDLCIDAQLMIKLEQMVLENWAVVQSRAKSFNMYVDNHLATKMGLSWESEMHKPIVDYGLLVVDSSESSPLFSRFEQMVKHSPSFMDPRMRFFGLKVIQKQRTIVGFYAIHSFPLSISKFGTYR